MNTSNAVQAVAAATETSAWITPLELGVLGAIWGASFMFMRVAAPEFGATPLVAIRLGLGATILLPFLWRGRRAFDRRLRPRLALIGAINLAIPFTLFGVGWAWLLLDEPLTVTMGIAGALILGSVVLSQRPAK